MNVTANSTIQMQYTQGSGIPYEGCNPGAESYVDFDLQYSLVDQGTGVSYLLYTDNGNGSSGQNCSPSIPPYWGHPFFNNPILTIPCNIPSSTYWLRVEMVNCYSSSYNIVYPYTYSQIEIRANDIDPGTTNTNTRLRSEDYQGQQFTMNSNADFADIMTVNVNNPNALSDLTSSITNTSCTISNGQISVTPVGGVAPFTYSWSSGQTTSTISNLSVGTYTVTVNDANGCSISKSYTIDYPYSYSVNIGTQQPCTYDESIMNAAAIGGVGPYSYLWSQGSATNSVYGAPIGNYSVTVTDANGCTASASTSLVSQTPASAFDYPNGVTINSASDLLIDADNDNVIEIRGTMTIAESVNYTLNGKTLAFARDLNPEIPDQGATHSGVIVSKKAQLKATNCTFKAINTSCGTMWDGIQVWGDDYLNVSAPSGFQFLVALYNILNPLDNGKLILKNSTVQDAKKGVALYRVNVPFIANNPEYGRGIINATSSTFKNNLIGIAFQGGTIVSNSSTIKGCNFSCDALLEDQIHYPGQGTSIQLELTRVKGPQITANTFKGNASLAEDKRAAGIRSYDAGYTVQSASLLPIFGSPLVPNTFTDLSQGIDVYSKGGAATSIKIKDNRFNNVFQGITANGSNFSEISFNTFNIPAGISSFNSWGVFLETSAGFLLTENTLNTLATSPQTFGIVGRNVNASSGDAYKNTFNGDFAVATQIEGASDNNLQVGCNQYLGNNTYDWYVTTPALVNQGNCGTITSPADNVFGSCVTADESQIYSVSNFAYTTNQNNIVNCFSPSITLIPCPLPSFIYSTSCPQDPNVTVPGSGGVINWGNVIAALENQLGNNPKVQEEINRILAWVDNVTELLNALQNGNSAAGKRIVVPTYLQRNEFTSARNELNSMLINTTDDQQFYNLFDVLIGIGESGRMMTDINTGEKQAVSTIAQMNVPTSRLAQSVLAELGKGYYIRFPEYPTTNTAIGMYSPNNANEQNAEASSHLSVYPNPSEGNAQINVEQQNEKNRAELPQFQSAFVLDMMGKIISTLDVQGKRSFQISSLAKGIYTLRVSYADGSVENKRIIIM